MSPIALVLPKQELHATGARPVIYGLSSSTTIPKGQDGGLRMIPQAALPSAEQYRYVTLGTYGSVDWTHEREWRWPYRGEMPAHDGMPPNDGKDIPGLKLDFEGMGVVTRSRKQAEKVLHDILVQSDMGAPGRYDFILVGDDIPHLNQLRDPDQLQKALSAAAIDLSPYRNMSEHRIEELGAEFDACVKSVDSQKCFELWTRERRMWLWITDAAHEMTRALVLSNRIIINAEGRYLVEIDSFPDSLSLSERENLTSRLASQLLDRFGLRATYHSVLGQDHPDGLPHVSEFLRLKAT